MDEPLVDWAADALLYTGYDRITSETQLDPPFHGERLGRRGSKNVQLTYVVRNEGPEPLRVVKLHSTSIESFRFRKKVVNAKGDALVVLDSEIAFRAAARMGIKIMEEVGRRFPSLKGDAQDAGNELARLMSMTDTDGCHAKPIEAATWFDQVQELRANLEEKQKEEFTPMQYDMFLLLDVASFALKGNPPMLVLLGEKEAVAPSNEEGGNQRVMLTHFASDVQMPRYAWDIDGLLQVAPWNNGHDGPARIWHALLRTPAYLVLLVLGYVYILLFSAYLLCRLVIGAVWWGFFARTFPRTVIIDRPLTTLSFQARYIAPAGMVMKQPYWWQGFWTFRPARDSERVPFFNRPKRIEGEWSVNRAWLPHAFGFWPKLELPSFDPQRLETDAGRGYKLIWWNPSRLEIVLPTRIADAWMDQALGHVEDFMERWNQATAGWRRFFVGKEWTVAPFEDAMDRLPRFWIRVRYAVPWYGALLTLGLYTLAVLAHLWITKNGNDASTLVQGNEVAFGAMTTLLAALVAQVFVMLEGSARALTIFRAFPPVIYLVRQYVALLAI